MTPSAQENELAATQKYKDLQASVNDTLMAFGKDHGNKINVKDAQHQKELDQLRRDFEPVQVIVTTVRQSAAFALSFCTYLTWSLFSTRYLCLWSFYTSCQCSVAIVSLICARNQSIEHAWCVFQRDLTAANQEIESLKRQLQDEVSRNQQTMSSLGTQQAALNAQAQVSAAACLCALVCCFA